MNEQPKSESREANDKGALSELYRKKKEIGRDAFEKERKLFSEIARKYHDVFEEEQVDIGARPDADKEQLESALEGLLDESHIEEYRAELDDINKKIGEIEGRLDDEIEADRDLFILQTEAAHMADDLPFRPREEWHEPLAEKIRAILYNDK